ncbi:MAG: tetratricopeptide repeat protein [Candidatus Melainabacteria bacterium]|nr:tetratricopeptide repeat protein [Candidatus Melainabacteria bacterium]
MKIQPPGLPISLLTKVPPPVLFDFLSGQLNKTFFLSPVFSGEECPALLPPHWQAVFATTIFDNLFLQGGFETILSSATTDIEMTKTAYETIGLPEIVELLEEATSKVKHLKVVPSKQELEKEMLEAQRSGKKLEDLKRERNFSKNNRFARENQRYTELLIHAEKRRTSYLLENLEAFSLHEFGKNTHYDDLIFAEYWNIKELEPFLEECDYEIAEFDSSRAAKLLGKLTRALRLKGMLGAADIVYHRMLPLLIGGFHGENEDVRKAILDYTKILDELGRSVEAEMLRANVFFIKAHINFLNGRLAEAERNSIEAKLHYPKEVSPWHIASIHAFKGELKMAQGKPEEALQEYNTALSMKDDLQWLELRANARIQLEDMDGALADYEKAIELAPRQINFYYRLGLLAANCGDFKRAEDAFSMIRKLDSEALNNLELYEVYLHAGYMEGAAREVERALLKDPGDSQALVKKGTLALLQGKNEAAVQTFKMALEQDPKNGEAWLALGNFYLHMGNFKECQKHLDKALKLEPNNPDFLASQATYLHASGQSAKAIKVLNNAIKLVEEQHRQEIVDQYFESDEDLDNVNVDNVNHKQNHSEAARLSANRANLDEMDFVAFYNLRALCYLDLKDYEQAIKDARYAYQFPFTRTATPLLVMAQAHLVMGDHDRAVRLAQDALSYDEELDWAHLIRAQGYLAKGNYAKSIKEATAAISISEGDGRAYFIRSIALTLSGNESKARKDIDRSAALGFVMDEDDALHHLVQKLLG